MGARNPGYEYSVWVWLSLVCEGAVKPGRDAPSQLRKDSDCVEPGAPHSSSNQRVTLSTSNRTAARRGITTLFAIEARAAIQAMAAPRTKQGRRCYRLVCEQVENPARLCRSRWRRLPRLFGIELRHPGGELWGGYDEEISRCGGCSRDAVRFWCHAGRCRRHWLQPPASGRGGLRCGARRVRRVFAPLLFPGSVWIQLDRRRRQGRRWAWCFDRAGQLRPRSGLHRGEPVAQSQRDPSGPTWVRGPFLS
jgi:hypothetical protein